MSVASTIPLRAVFRPVNCDVDNLDHPALPSTGESAWIPLITSSADFPLELLEPAVSQLIHHPEYNSTLILRSDTVFEHTSDFPVSVPTLEGLKPIKTVHRKLLPRRPGRDAGLEQYCTLYTSKAEDKTLSPISTLILTPIVPPGESLPYYHPAVSHIAFRYITGDTPMLRIEVVPLPNTPMDPNSRLYRTCLALLETLHRYGWGAMTQYKKRVNHDCLVPRDLYQDIYLLMRERHKHIINEWQEVTDPLKHVFEDIGIATFMMLLWKDTYKTDESVKAESEPTDPARPWLDWPRPQAGFLDFGCGNGLLTHILIAEGYIGEGIDLRARTSWKHYPQSSQDHLHCHAFAPTLEVKDPFLVPGVFIIGNHADELTPWLPVLSTLYSTSGYISIPCCAWTFDTRYERSSTEKFPIPTPSEEFVENLNLGGEGSNTSSYSSYRIWLASLSLWCGWEVETEVLRIPSTRNWAIVGRKKLDADAEEQDFKGNCEDIVEGVRERGIFKSRKPEGKRDGRH